MWAERMDVQPGKTDSSLGSAWRSLHHPGVVPVEFLASDGKDAAHALEDVAHVFVHLLDLHLVRSFSSIDGGDDVFAVGCLQGDVGELLVQGELDVALLEVVVVDVDPAGQSVRRGVDSPDGLPLPAPEVGEVRVDAADVDLQLAFAVEAEAGARRTVPVVSLDVGVNGRLDTSPGEKWRD